MTIEQLRHAAHLAAIALTEEEELALLDALQELEPVFSFLSVVANADADTILPSDSAGFPDSLRPDIPVSGCHRDALLRNAPAAAEGCFIVKRQLPQEEECT